MEEVLRMKSRWFFLPLLAVLAFPSEARADVSADLDGLRADVKGVVAQARETAGEDVADVDGVRIQYRTDRDCVRFSFDPGGPEKSEAVWLRSTEWTEECHWQGDPRNGGRQVCREVPRWTYRERVQLELQNRKNLLPWERETFTVCLDGRWLSAYATSVAHKYKAERDGGYYLLTAGEKIAMDPDKSGLQAAAPRNAGSKLLVDITDKWAEYYKGESTEIEFEVWRDIPNWFDSKITSGKMKFDAAGKYSIDLAADGKLKAGKKYYMKWGFRRLGKVSKDTYMKKGETDGTVYKPAAQGIFVFAR